MSHRALGRPIPVSAPPQLPKRSPLRPSTPVREDTGTPRESYDLGYQASLVEQRILCADTFRGGLRIASAPSGSLSFMYNGFHPMDVVLSPHPKATLQRRPHIRRPRSMSNPESRSDIPSEPPRPPRPILPPIITQNLPSQLATKQMKARQVKTKPASIHPTVQNAHGRSGSQIPLFLIPGHGKQITYASVRPSIVPPLEHPPQLPLQPPSRKLPTASTTVPQSSTIHPPPSTAAQTRYPVRPLPILHDLNSVSSIPTSSPRIYPLPTAPTSLPVSHSSQSPTQPHLPSRTDSVKTQWSQDSAPPTGAPPTRRQSFAASYHYKAATGEECEIDTIAVWTGLDVLLHKKGVDHTITVEDLPVLPTPLSMHEPHQPKRADTATVRSLLIERWNRAHNPVAVV
ncbi:hypothetical protein BS47DRAFT_1339272 [Hydnum rufescens UP504]|uniref:Uncharacterized protein n=1 Tax=Hydnum rufescens UP504 TaxID=1448309 RepID=A0A9P6DXH3_9AGAM|nr:hypothetical protein BS47DRAFT_1339272 [Hydnum rufescens UP504]